jgi:ABC-type transport system, involved in lipoprotein release, permease component
MNFRVSVMLALRFLGIGAGRTRSNARRSLYGAIAGIGISLVPLVIVLVVSDGMIEGISSRIIELSTTHFRVEDYTGDPGTGGTAEDFEQIARQLKDEDQTGRITATWCERQGIGIAIGPKGRSGATVRAVDPSFLAPGTAASDLLTVDSGTLDLSGGNGALIGRKLAADIGVSAGDSFRVLTMRTSPSGQSIPRFTTCTVRGVISSGYQEMDALWVFIPFSTGFRILSPELSSTFINVHVTEPFGSLEPVRHGLMRSAPAGFTVYTWKELNRSQFQSFNTTRTLLVFIMLLIVFIASINVSSALVMLVMERRKEIAILKSSGASPAGITMSFLLAGFLTGVGGLAAGLPAGILCSLHINDLFAFMERGLNLANRLAYVIGHAGGPAAGEPDTIRLLDPAYYLEVIPVHLQAGELFVIAAGTLVLSVLVSILPAVRAGQEKPLETLRKF